MLIELVEAVTNLSISGLVALDLDSNFIGLFDFSGVLIVCIMEPVAG